MQTTYQISAYNSSDSSQSENECPVCLTEFDLKIHKPQIVLCQHSLCRECVKIFDQTANDHTFNCPNCREKVKASDYKDYRDKLSKMRTKLSKHATSIINLKPSQKKQSQEAVSDVLKY